MDEERVEVAPPPRSVFSREQKVGYAVVILCGALTVVFGMFYLSKHLQSPFVISYSGARLLTGEEEEAAEIAKQKSADTDGDEVNDYDELNIYGSSPYLVDTDSDGIADNVEILSGGDPACAKGTACEDEQDEIVAGSSIDDGVVGDVRDASADAAAAASAQFAQVKAMLESLTAEEVRTMLVDSGADAQEIAALTDEEVMTLYGSVLAELEANGGLDQLLQQLQQLQTTAQ